MKLAIVFPGQGAQYPGMGKALAGAYPSARRFLDRADQILGQSISSLCFRGTPQELAETRNTQPAIFVINQIASTLLREAGFEPDAVMGHSLGEYNALAAAGSLSFDDGLRLIAERSRLMQEQAERRPGMMAAVLGLNDDLVRELLDDTGVVVANFNCPGQVVVSGPIKAVERVMPAIEKAGAKRIVRLAVSGAFHSPLMSEAAEKLAEVLDAVEFHNAYIPVAANLTGRFSADAGELKEALRGQMTSPVKWRSSVEAALAGGIDTFVETGPGTVLSGLIRRTTGDRAGITVLNVEDPVSLAKTIERIKDKGGS